MQSNCAEHISFCAKSVAVMGNLSLKLEHHVKVCFCVSSTQCRSILCCSPSSVKISLNSSISLTSLSAISFTTLRSLVNILYFFHPSKSHHLSREYVRKLKSCKQKLSRWNIITDRSGTRSETQLSKDTSGKTRFSGVRGALGFLTYVTCF